MDQSLLLPETAVCGMVYLAIISTTQLLSAHAGIHRKDRVEFQSQQHAVGEPGLWLLEDARWGGSDRVVKKFK